MAFTFFFRDLDAIKLISEFVIPELPSSGIIKIWDAGCANGPEIYSLLIYLKEKTDADIFERIRIYASDIDISNRFKNVIETGNYLKNQMSSVPPHILKKYFGKSDDSHFYTVDSGLREKVIYVKHNLLTLEPFETGFNLVLCKHVLEHFSPEKQEDVVRMFHECLLKDSFFLTEYSYALPFEYESLFKRPMENKNLYRKRQ